MNRSRVGAQCKSCGRSILWLKHERTGNSAPIVQIASADGNIAIDEEKGTWRIVTTLTERDQLIGRLRKSHFSTCPNAAEHKKR